MTSRRSGTCPERIRGGLPGNSNAIKTGLYSSAFPQGERIRLGKKDSSLESEIKAYRPCPPYVAGHAPCPHPCLSSRPTPRSAARTPEPFRPPGRKKITFLSGIPRSLRHFLPLNQSVAGHIGNDLGSDFAIPAADDADETVNAESGLLHCLADPAGVIGHPFHHGARHVRLVMAHRQADVSASGIVVEHGGVLSGKPGQENQPARAGRHRGSHGA